MPFPSARQTAAIARINNDGNGNGNGTGIGHDGTPQGTLRRWPKRARIAPLALLLGALLLCALLLGAIWMVHNHYVQSERAATHSAARASVQALVDAYETQLTRNLNAIDRTLKFVKYAAELKGTAGALPSLRDKGLLSANLRFVTSIADRNGVIVATSLAARPINVSAQRYFQFHRQHDGDTPFVGEMVRDGANARWHLHFTRRINDVAGRFAGIAIVEVEPAYFTSGYQHAQLGERGAIGLFGDDGAFLALRSGDKVSWGQQAGPVFGVDPARAAPSAWDGVARYTAVRRLHGFALTAMVALERDEHMLAFVKRSGAYLWVATFASALLLLIVALVCVWAWQGARTRRRIRRAQATFAAASEASLDAFLVMRSVLDAGDTIVDFRIEACNGRTQTMLGVERDALIGNTLLGVLPQYRDNGIFDDLVKTARSGGMREAEWRGQGARSRNLWMHRQVVALEDGVVAIVRDISARKLAEQHIEHMAHHDTLTGLPNRNRVRERIDQAIVQAQREGRCVAVAFIDLDSFKLVNDGLGHSAGDALLKVAAARMQGCVRRADTLGRFGGDEFVIILADLADDAQRIAPLLDALRCAVSAPLRLAGQDVHLSCSIGVALYPRDGAEPNALMTNADAAMHRAKQLGRNNVQFYTRDMNARMEEKRRLLDGLRSALDERQFTLLYQPKIDLRSGRMVGVEALIRWHHPEHGMVPPLRFIGLAEESGLIVAIGEWVLRTACRQNMAWRAAGLPLISMSVNVSPRQFEAPHLVERIAQALQESALPAAALELEVTESLIMRDLAQALGTMGELKAMGVALSIDDFGTGHSSLAALKSFPIGSLKLDKSFVSELADNPDDQAIALAVISLGHKLNLRVIAEGVETEQQRRFLRENGCDEMQGNLFSAPISPDQVATLLRNQAQVLEVPVAASCLDVAAA
ncbi:MAG: EAL domain-containing protein [Massilia sp.]|nr:EAL domain-containing protein [Massilia sp.]